MSEDLQGYIAEQVQLFDDPASDEAFHNLIELPRDAIPLLQKAYDRQDNPQIRARIIEVIWQFRDRSTLPFLADALKEEDDEIWKQALDGIVTIGGDEAFAILKAVQTESASDNKRAWIEEAKEKTA